MSSLWRCRVNATIFYAVAIGLLTVLGAGLAGHLAANKWWHKWFFWGSGLLIVVLIYFQARSYKEPPTAEEIAVAVQRKLSETQNINTQQAPSSPPVVAENKVPHSLPQGRPKKGAAQKPPEMKSTSPAGDESLPQSAHLTVTQSLRTSTRTDAPTETEVVVQTDKVFSSLKFVMQCDKPLVDAHTRIEGAGAQMAVSSGLVQDHPHIVVYSYGLSAPPFGPANPLVIDVWSKDPVTCNKVTTF